MLDFPSYENNIRQIAGKFQMAVLSSLLMVVMRREGGCLNLANKT